MPRVWLCCALSLGLAASSPGRAATILERAVHHTVLADGRVHEATRLRVRLETAEDVEAWSQVPIYLDENRELLSVEAFSRGPSGETLKVRRKDKDSLEVSGEGVLHASSRFELLGFRGLAPGWEVVADYVVEKAPYHPSGAIRLVAEEPIRELSVEVAYEGDPAALRFRLDGEREGLSLSHEGRRIRITATDLPAAEPYPHALGGANLNPTLRYAWDGEAGWSRVGAWYSELLADVARASEAELHETLGLLRADDPPRRRLDQLADFVSGAVRYVAVEVGIGGYRPSEPTAVLARRWGDCKDKALLLIDLLRWAEIPAYPALVLAADERRIDAEFPSPGQFNHLIVAVPKTAVETAPEDPVAGGYLFIDPTLPRGAGRWLGPATQGQHALVVRPGAGDLIETPVGYSTERRRLAVDLELAPDGDAGGTARLQLSGRPAALFLGLEAGSSELELTDAVRRAFALLLPGAELGGFSFTPGDTALPAVELAAEIRLPGLIQGAPERPSFRLPEFQATPKPALLAEGEGPLALGADTTELHWTLALPAGWCPPRPEERRIENPVGRFEQELAPRHDGGFRLRREVVIRRRFLEEAEVEQLRELALAEHRASRRRIRLRCPEAADPAPGEGS